VSDDTGEVRERGGTSKSLGLPTEKRDWKRSVTTLRYKVPGKNTKKVQRGKRGNFFICDDWLVGDSQAVPEKRKTNLPVDGTR